MTARDRMPPASLTRCQALREQLGLSRADWARALNVDERTAVRWEEQGIGPGGSAEEIMQGIEAAIAQGISPSRVGALVNLGGIRSLICYALAKRLGPEPAIVVVDAPRSKNGHNGARKPARR